MLLKTVFVLVNNALAAGNPQPTNICSITIQSYKVLNKWWLCEIENGGYDLSSKFQMSQQPRCHMNTIWARGNHFALAFCYRSLQSHNCYLQTSMPGSLAS